MLPLAERAAVFAPLSLATVRPNVASATDGNAPNDPANLLSSKEIANQREGRHNLSADQETDRTDPGPVLAIVGRGACGS